MRVPRIALYAAMVTLTPMDGFSQGRAELRADMILAEPAAIHAGAGLLFPVGTYVRSGFVAGAGIADRSASFRLDLVAAFHLDPFRESRWGPYGGGGLSLRHDTGTDQSKTALLLLVGVEGPVHGSFAPAVEVGLGGGVRASVIMRRAGGRTR